MEHTMEPWIVGETNTNPNEQPEIAIMDSHGYCPAVAIPCGGGNEDFDKATTMANALRIVTCVNALAGIPTEEVEGFVRKAREGWKTIDSAPTEGDFLVWDKSHGIRVGCTHIRTGEYTGHPQKVSVYDGRGQSFKGGIIPTHWMPLPTPPDVRKAGV